MNNRRLNHHIFATASSHLPHLLPNAFVFTTERGERCVRLHSCWSELLVDCRGLGPVAIVSQSSSAQFASCVAGLDFAPVPDSTEIVELGSGLIADTAEWSHVLAVEEPVPHGYRFSLQFFTADGQGLWKVLLTSGAQLEYFADMARHYASSTLPPPPPIHQACASASRLTELHASERTCAYAVPDEALATLLLAARREERALAVTVGRGRLQFSRSLVPRALERCACTFHAYDYDAELHLHLGESATCWWVRGREGWVLEILDPAGQLAARLR